MAKIDKGDECSNIISTSGATTIVQLPLAFVRSGYVCLSYGYVSNVGEYGCAWSRTPKSSTHAYYLGMHPTYVNPSDYYIRYGGFPLRCLYPGSA